MPRLDRVAIRGFKSIRAVEDFEPRPLSVLIGPNGAGKTNFIDLFRMLARMAEGRLQVFVAEQDGPDALMFGGRRRTERIETELRFGANAYCFSLVPAGRRLVFGSEETRFLGWSSKTHTHSLGSGHAESSLEAADEAGSDTFAPYVRKAIAGWRVYHFHDTSTTAPVRQAHGLRDNLLLKPDAGNLARFCGASASTTPITIDGSSRWCGWRPPSSETSSIAAIPATTWSSSGSRRTTGTPCSAHASCRTVRCALSASPPFSPARGATAGAGTHRRAGVGSPSLRAHPAGRDASARQRFKQIIASTQSADLVSELDPENVVVVDRKEGASTFTRPDGTA